MSIFTLFVASTLIILNLTHRLFRLIVPTWLLPDKHFQPDDVILVTGAASGLGRQIAITAATKFNASKLLLWDRNSTALADVKKELITLCPSTQVWTQVVNLLNKDHIQSACDTAMAQYGHISHVIMCAGILNGKTFYDLTDDEIDSTIKVNLMAPIWMTKKFLPSMVKKQNGTIVAIASTAGLMPHPHEVDYCASKYGLVGMCECLQLELTAHDIKNVTITCICPSWIDTPLVPTEFQPKSVLKASDVAENTLRSMLFKDSFVIIAPILDRFMYILKTLADTAVWTIVFNLIAQPLRLANYGRVMAARRTYPKTL